MAALERFFPFNPRTTRITFMVCAAACAVLAAWALADLNSGVDLAVPRLALCGLLLLAFAFGLWRLRPREGWGVRLHWNELELSRPFGGDPIHIPWSAVRAARREGSRGQVLVLFLPDEGRVQIARHLFPSAKDFEALSTAISARVPPLDA